VKYLEEWENVLVGAEVEARRIGGDTEPIDSDLEFGVALRLAIPDFVLDQMESVPPFVGFASGVWLGLMYAASGAPNPFPALAVDRE
jgi:hypothetical protein